MYAACNGYTEVVEKLIEAKANVDMQEKDDGWTALICAAKNGHIEIVELLLQRGANIHITDANGKTFLDLVKDSQVCIPLLELVAKYKPEDTKDFLSSEPDLISKLSKEDKLGEELKSIVNEVKNKTPLHFAAYNGHAEVLELLLKDGANVDERNANNSTPLHFAAQEGHVKAVELLLKHNADTSLQSDVNGGYTALHFAADEGHVEVVELLIEKGANIDARNNDGYKPIHLAAKEDHIEIVELLSKQPANKVDAQDNKLFSVVKCVNNVQDPSKEYGKLFTRDTKNILNSTITHCITQIELLNKIFKKNTKHSDDISKGICQSFSTLASLINLNSKEDFDELYSLMDFEPEKLNEENLKKFLKNELDDKKLKAVFELVQAMVEYSPILEAENIGRYGNCEQQLPKETLIRDILDNCYDMQSNRIDINKPLVSKILEELKDKDTILYLVSNICKDGSGHAMSITKTCVGKVEKYIFFDSDAPNALELSSEEEVCHVMELAANRYCQSMSPTGLSGFPEIEIIHSTETTKKVIEHYAREHENKPNSRIWNIRVEAVKEGLIDPKHQNISIY